MKTLVGTLVAAVVVLQWSPALGQPGAGGMMGRAPRFDGAVAKLFGENSAFSAGMEIENKPESGPAMSIPGKVSFDQGKARFEINIGEMKGGNMPPEAAQQMKAMGLDKMVVIARPDKKVTYMAYPSLKAHIENPLDEGGAADPQSLAKYKLETTEVGKETVDGHPCVKNKAVITGGNEKRYEATVWNATDLKNFPIRIVHEQKDGGSVAMGFKEVKLGKPAAKEFELPEGSTKYDNMMAMMQEQMMKQMGGGAPGGPSNK